MIYRNSKNDSTFIIAEAGVNHNGDFDLAKKLIDVAADSNVDAVKFQTFRVESLVTENAPKATYQKISTSEQESQRQMLEALEISFPLQFKLMKYAESRGILFLSTPFDPASLDFLLNDIKLETIKIGSGDLTNGPLLLNVARSRRDVILSTGMASLSEIEDALAVLAFGFVAGKDAKPNKRAFNDAYVSPDGQKLLQSKVSLMHCTSEYPCPFNEINLKAITTLKLAFGLDVGYSDHSQGIHVCLAAVAMGAQIIEKHFTLDKNMKGPDHKSSIEPYELGLLVKQVRDIEAAKGQGVKIPQPSEIANRQVSRKSLVVTDETCAGDILELSSIRAGEGVSPMEYWKYNNTPAKKNFKKGELFDE